jgi:hypothetical protein
MKTVVKTRLVVLCIGLLLLCYSRAIAGEALPHRGYVLEVEDPREIYVFIAPLSEDDQKIGLTRDLIQTKVELQLRRNGITPNTVAVAENITHPYLTVTVIISGDAFSILIFFSRIVYFSVNGRTYETMATVWSKGSTGIYANQSSFILQSLADRLDSFINGYLKANPIQEAPSNKVIQPSEKTKKKGKD